MAANLITRLLPIQHHEVSSTLEMHSMGLRHQCMLVLQVPAVAQGFGALGCSLAAYFILSPLRDVAAVSIGEVLRRCCHLQ